MRTARVLAALVLLGCGGRAVESIGDAGGRETSGSTDGGWGPDVSGSIPPCPPGLDVDANCAGTPIMGNDCFTCGSDGGGDHWHCNLVSPGNAYWTLTPYQCLP